MCQDEELGLTMSVLSLGPPKPPTLLLRRDSFVNIVDTSPRLTSYNDTRPELSPMTTLCFEGFDDLDDEGGRRTMVPSCGHGRDVNKCDSVKSSSMARKAGGFGRKGRFNWGDTRGGGYGAL